MLLARRARAVGGGTAAAALNENAVSERAVGLLDRSQTAVSALTPNELAFVVGARV